MGWGHGEDVTVCQPFMLVTPYYWSKLDLFSGRLHYHRRTVSKVYSLHFKKRGCCFIFRESWHLGGLVLWSEPETFCSHLLVAESVIAEFSQRCGGSLQNLINCVF